jgi:hypothetical protein
MKNYRTPQTNKLELRIFSFGQYTFQLQEDFPFVDPAICPGEVRDTYNLNVLATGGTITVSLQPSATIDTKLVVREPVTDSEVQCLASGNGNGVLDKISFSPTTTGDFRIIVVDPVHVVGGTYSLSVSSTQNNIVSPISDEDDSCVTTPCD